MISLNQDVLTKAAPTSNNPALDQDIARLRHLSAAAPTEIRADVQAVADFDEQFLTANRGGADLQQTPGLAARIAHLAQWISKNCVP